MGWDHGLRFVMHPYVATLGWEAMSQKPSHRIPGLRTERERPGHPPFLE